MSHESLISPRVDVPLVDLTPAHDPVKSAILRDLSELIDGGVFLNGPEVAAFEEAFATYCHAQHCVGVASGLDALRLALLAAELEPGDEVIVPAHTFVATFEAVAQAGGVPVPVDVTTQDYNLDVEAAEAAIGEGTRFLLPVDLYGQLADGCALRDLADGRGLEIVEDACQAHGAARDGVTAGTIGLAGAFSFYPTKNLGAMGDAGAIVTDDGDLASCARALREHGETSKYMHDAVGYTARMDGVQALVLLHKLPLLEEWTELRRAIARRYAEALEGAGDLVLPPVPPGSDPVWHLFVVRTGRSSELAEFLGGRGIATGRHYPKPPHLTTAFAHLGYGPGSFPVAEALARDGLSLPLFPGLTEVQLDAVTGGVTDFFARA
jgi:dTDP-3-amino-3,4,6-trideoxy-alpha-D-glucose transaminase